MFGDLILEKALQILFSSKSILWTNGIVSVNGVSLEHFPSYPVRPGLINTSCFLFSDISTMLSVKHKYTVIQSRE